MDDLFSFGDASNVPPAAEEGASALSPGDRTPGPGDSATDEPPKPAEDMSVGAVVAAATNASEISPEANSISTTLEERPGSPLPLAEPTIEPKAEPIAEPTIEPRAEPTIEPMADPMVEPMADPVAEPMTERGEPPVAGSLAADDEDDLLLNFDRADETPLLAVDEAHVPVAATAAAKAGGDAMPLAPSAVHAAALPEESRGKAAPAPAQAAASMPKPAAASSSRSLSSASPARASPKPAAKTPTPRSAAKPSTTANAVSPTKVAASPAEVMPRPRPSAMPKPAAVASPKPASPKSSAATAASPKPASPLPSSSPSSSLSSSTSSPTKPAGLTAARPGPHSASSTRPRARASLPASSNEPHKPVISPAAKKYDRGGKSVFDSLAEDSEARQRRLKEQKSKQAADPFAVTRRDHQPLVSPFASKKFSGSSESVFERLNADAEERGQRYLERRAAEPSPTVRPGSLGPAQSPTKTTPSRGAAAAAARAAATASPSRASATPATSAAAPTETTPGTLE